MPARLYIDAVERSYSATIIAQPDRERQQPVVGERLQHVVDVAAVNFEVLEYTGSSHSASTATANTRYGSASPLARIRFIATAARRRAAARR